MFLNHRSAIHVLNESTVVNNSEVRSWCKAVNYQIKYSVAPAWGMKPKSIKFHTSSLLIPKNSWVIAVLDDADQADALGYHSVDRRGRVYGRVFAATAMSYGQKPSVTFSHEILETFGDPGVDAWAPTGEGYEVPVELCDAVEGDTYAEYDIAVSNFLLPAWFDARSVGPWDFLETTPGPFKLAPKGYTIRRHPNGVIDEVFGESAGWDGVRHYTAKLHALGRTARRRTG